MSKNLTTDAMRDSWQLLKYLHERLKLMPQDLVTLCLDEPSGLQIRIVWFRGREGYYFKETVSEQELMNTQYDIGGSPCGYWLDRLINHAEHIYANYMEDFKRKMEGPNADL